MNEYRKKRSFAIHLFGIFMIAVSVLLLLVGPISTLHERKHATAYVTGEVVSVKEDELKIYYTLPGEDEGWLVTKKGSGWKKGDQVKVFYNPSNLSEKYIEGFQESPWAYVFLSVFGMAQGIAALFVANASKGSDAINKLIDQIDR